MYYDIIVGKQMLMPRVRNEKIDINEINWTPNQCIGYLNLYVKTAKRAVPNP